MEIKGLRFSQQGRDMFVTVLSGKTVAAISDVDSVNKHPGGYQREREPSRCEDLRAFIEQARGLVPGALLLNVRPEDESELAFTEEGTIDGGGFGSLRLPDREFAWQIDGQHRVGAYERLADDIQIPVVFIKGLDRPQEAKLFFIVNSKQKNVSASLRYYDLMRYAEDEVKRWLLKGEKESQELAYNIVVALNEDGLWKGRINLAGVRGMKRAINLKGYMDALEPVVKDRWFATLPFDRQTELMKNFWAAADKTWPGTLGPDGGSLLTKTFGVHVAGGIAIDIFHYCAQADDFSESFMAALLESTQPVVGDWDPHGPLSAYAGGGGKAVRIAIDVLRATIRQRFEEMRVATP